MKKYLIGATVALLFSTNAMAANLVTNGDFETTTLANSAQISGNAVAGWTNEAKPGQYTGQGYNFLIKPNTADTTGFTSLGNNVDKIYGPNGGVNSANYSNNGFTGVSPTGGNFLLADGDTGFHGKISQVISGLTVNQVYSLTFDWAGVSWFTTPGQTTERWDVSFGGTTQSTNTLTLAPKGFSGWQKGSMQFTATGTSQTLSFLAQGTPNGLPPSLLLDNVQLAAVPEPATWGMMLMGFGAIGSVIRRRRGAPALQAA